MPTVPMHFFVPSVLVLLKMYRNTMYVFINLRQHLVLQNTSCNITDRSVKPSPTDTFRTNHQVSPLLPQPFLSALYLFNFQWKEITHLLLMQHQEIIAKTPFLACIKFHFEVSQQTTTPVSADSSIRITVISSSILACPQSV